MQSLTKKSVFALATFGAATWVAAMVTGQLVIFLTGIPASSGLVNGFVVPFLLVLGALALKTRWSVTISFTVYGILSIPVLLLGPPGVHKIIVAFIAGFMTDIFIIILDNIMDKYKRKYIITYALSFGIWGFLLTALARLAYAILPLPGKEKFLSAFWVLAIIFVIEAVMGSLLASILWAKRNMDEHPLIERLRN